MDRPLTALVAEEKKTATRYNKLLSRTTGQFTIKNVKVHVMNINKDGIPNEISTNRAMPVPTMTHG